MKRKLLLKNIAPENKKQLIWQQVMIEVELDMKSRDGILLTF